MYSSLITYKKTLILFLQNFRMNNLLEDTLHLLLVVLVDNGSLVAVKNFVLWSAVIVKKTISHLEI